MDEYLGWNTPAYGVLFSEIDYGCGVNGGDYGDGFGDYMNTGDCDGNGSADIENGFDGNSYSNPTTRIYK